MTSRGSEAIPPSPSTESGPPGEPPGRAGRWLALAGALESVNIWVGRAVSWLAVLMVLVTFLVVVLRYAFDLGWIAMQESITYMHAALFMLGAAFTLQQDGHVRVDILYQKLSRRGQALVDLLGTLLLLLPVAGFIVWTGWGYVDASWGDPARGIPREGSRETGGIPAVYLLKTLIVIMPSLLALQGLAMLVRNALYLAGVESALRRAHAEARDD